jgi:hypothetical protein
MWKALLQIFNEHFSSKIFSQKSKLIMQKLGTNLLSRGQNQAELLSFTGYLKIYQKWRANRVL